MIDTNDEKSGPFADIPKLEFAPINVPLARRRQTFAAYIYSTLIWHVLALFIYLCTIPLFWPFILAYLIYIAIDKTSINGGRASDYLQNLFIWKWLAEFFPATLKVEYPLDPAKTYIFGYHPHGILSTGAFINFSTQATGLGKKLPGLKVHLLTLNTNFFVPLYREILFALGMASVSKTSILNILSKGPGSTCVIVVGGAQESLSAKPELADLVLSKRYGFVKLALQTGSSLVPVFGFGENSLYDQILAEPGSRLHLFQKGFKKFCGFTIPLFFGRGIFNYNFGLLPRRRRLTIIVGKPIDLIKDENPTQEKVASIHSQYMDSLRELYDRNKHKYHEGSNPPPIRFI